MTRRPAVYVLPVSALCWALGGASGGCSTDAGDRSPGIDVGGRSAFGHGGQGAVPSAMGGINDGPGGGSQTDGGEGGTRGGTGDTATAGNGIGAGGVRTGEPPHGPSVCSQTAMWSHASAVSGVSGAGGVTLLSLTPDELDLAFLRAGGLYVAHRAQASVGFEPGTPVSIPSGFSAAEGAALSADGRRLILVADPGQRKLGEMTRAARNVPFTNSVDESAFALVNQDSVYTGRLYASPVLSADDTQLMFNSSFPSGPSTVVVSTGGPGNPWSRPGQLAEALLDGEGALRRLPTALSADARTLFYFNEQTMSEEARFRNEPTSSSQLYDLLGLGSRRGAAPNAACDHLYSAANGEIVVETE